MRSFLRPCCSAFLAAAVCTAAAAKPVGNGLSSLPITAQGGISAALGHDVAAFAATLQAGGLHVANQPENLTVDFSSSGVNVSSGAAHWGLQVSGYGYGHAMNTVNRTEPHARANRVEYRHGELREWYVNGPMGVEQGFTIQSQPSGSDGQPLVVALDLSGDMKAVVDRDGQGLILAGRDGNASLRYAGLMVRDATGKELHAWMELQGSQLLLKTDDRSARFPVVVDPWMRKAVLSPSDSQSRDEFGFSVAASGDTIVVGAAGLSPGRAYVFVKPAHGSTNMTETAQLTASDGQEGGNVGFSVSIAGDIIVCGPGSNQGRGEVYVFVKPPNGWVSTTETAKLTASDGREGDELGVSVSVSGNTVVAGAPGRNQSQGAVYLFVKPKAGWKDMTQTAQLTASGGAASDKLGYSVAISGDTVVASAPGANTIFVFAKPADSRWKDAAQTAKLSTSDRGADTLAVAVAGDTVVGTANDYRTIGAAYVFVEPPGGWADMTETAKLTAFDQRTPNGFGVSVAISKQMIAVGGPGHAGKYIGVVYLYLKSESGWVTTSHYDAKFVDKDKPRNGLPNSVAISGKAVVAGLPDGEGTQGAAFVFAK